LFGFTAQQTLDYAQSLYEKALLSYPRSDSKYLTSDMRDSVVSLVEWIQLDMERKDGADFVPDIDRLIDNGKVSDHHAIIPTNAIITANLPSLPTGELSLLNLVACRLLCAVAPAYVYEAGVVTMDCEGIVQIATSTPENLLSNSITD
jgi:DNA topoisomerase-3